MQPGLRIRVLYGRKQTPENFSWSSNRPLALRGHVTSASFKQWVGILLIPKIDRARKNYLTPEIWEESHLREIFYGTLPCWRAAKTTFCLYLVKLLIGYAHMCCKRYHIIFSTISLKLKCKTCVQKEGIRNFKDHILVTWSFRDLPILRKWCRFEKLNHYYLFKLWPTNRFSEAKSFNFHFYINDVTWSLSANGLFFLISCNSTDFKRFTITQNSKITIFFGRYFFTFLTLNLNLWNNRATNKKTAFFSRARAYSSWEGQHSIYSKLSIVVQETLRSKSERFYPVFSVVMNSPEINKHSNIPRDEKSRKGCVPRGRVRNRQGGLAYNAYHLS